MKRPINNLIKPKQHRGFKMSKYANYGIEWIESIEQWNVNFMIGGKMKHIGLFNELGDELGAAVVDRAIRAAEKEPDGYKADAVLHDASKWLMDLGEAQIQEAKVLRACHSSKEAVEAIIYQFKKH